MKRVIIVVLLLVLLCGCGAKEEPLPTSVTSDKLPIDFQVDGEKCSFTILSFLEDGEDVYIVAVIEASKETAGKLDTMCVDYQVGNWGNHGRKVFAMGSHVYICSKFLKSTLGDTLDYSFFILGEEDGLITYNAKVKLEPYEGFPSAVRMKMEAQ